MSSSTPAFSRNSRLNKRRFLTPEQIAMVDEALCALGDFGEVRLVVEKGRLRFVVTQKSYDALKWRPGVIGRIE